MAFLFTSSNDLEIFAYIIGNAELNNNCREKLWTEAVTEFGTEKGMAIITARVLYGLNSSGDARRNVLAEPLRSLGYKYYEVDADLWMKRYFKPNRDPNYK